MVKMITDRKKFCRRYYIFFSACVDVVAMCRHMSPSIVASMKKSFYKNIVQKE